MRKAVALAIAAAVVLLFAALIIDGVRRASPPPQAAEYPRLRMPFLDAGIDLSGGIAPELWEGLPATEVTLVHQLMVLPWPRDAMSPLTVRAFSNSEDAYFLFTWRDDTEDRAKLPGEFPDAAAVLFTLTAEEQPSSVLMMGFLGPANIWQWKGHLDSAFWHGEEPDIPAEADFRYPFEENETLPVSKAKAVSAARDLIALGPGTITEKAGQRVSGRGVWENGTWHVVMRRSIAALDAEADASFPAGDQRVAFALWNGAFGDRGGRKSISDWVVLEVEG